MTLLIYPGYTKRNISQPRNINSLRRQSLIDDTKYGINQQSHKCILIAILDDKSSYDKCLKKETLSLIKKTRKYMLPKITDTNPEAEKIQVLLIRKASIAKRVSRMRSLSQTTIQLSRRALLRSNPKLSEKELNLTFVSHHYGKDLASVSLLRK